MKICLPTILEQIEHHLLELPGVRLDPGERAQEPPYADRPQRGLTEVQKAYLH